MIENYEDAAIAWDASLDGGRWKVTSGLSAANPDVDRITSSVYDGMGNVIRQVAHLPSTSTPETVQVTEYKYDAQVATGSLVESKGLLSEVHYPDETTGSPNTSSAYTVKYRYNRLGELLEITDQNQTEHTYTRDSLGRVLRDDATAFGTGIDQAVKGIEVEYDGFGRLERVLSRDATGGSGNIVSEVEFAYTPLWQVESVIQDPDSALSVIGGNSIPQRTVAYSYDTQPIGTGNYTRLDTMLYPGGESYGHGYAVAAWDDRISRLSSLDIGGGSYPIEYHFVGLSMFAGVDYVAPEIQLDRTLDAAGQRRLGGYTSQTAGVYPGWDRFGRVISQAWVDADLTTGTGGLPDRPQIVYDTHTYDRSSNRLSKFDDRDGLAWASQDNQYTYDGLDRLIEAKRGRWTGSSLTHAAGGVSARDSSQQWTLDMLGNWNAFARDLSGNGLYTDTADLVDTRVHNAANEIETSSTRHDGTTPPPPNPVPFAYDDAGNLKSARLETTTSTTNLVGRRYIHDAWNRLVEVIHDNSTSTTSDDFTIARYAYNGLHWRVLKRADMRTVQTAPSSGYDSTNRREAMYYDASWRLVHREVEDGFDPAASPAPWNANRAEQLFWGARYIDDIVARRRSTTVLSPEPLSVTWGGPDWYLTDAQFSVVAMMDTGGVQVLERVRYDPYGNAEHLDMADFNGNGEVTVQDLFDHQAAYFGGDLMGDFNRNGAFTNQDLFDFQAAYFGASSRPATPHGSGWVSHPDAAGGGSDSVVGYCGYLFNHETSDCTVRFRHYSPSLGRWLERDPEGYIDGANLSQYVVSAPVYHSDPSGTDTYRTPKDPGSSVVTGGTRCKDLEDVVKKQQERMSREKKRESSVTLSCCSSDPFTFKPRDGQAPEALTTDLVQEIKQWKEKPDSVPAERAKALQHYLETLSEIFMATDGDIYMFSCNSGRGKGLELLKGLRDLGLLQPGQRLVGYDGYVGSTRWRFIGGKFGKGEWFNWPDRVYVSEDPSEDPEIAHNETKKDDKKRDKDNKKSNKTDKQSGECES